MHSLDDTIAAIATPPGEGGIAIVRLSGPEAEGIGGRLLRTRAGAGVPMAPRSVSVAFAVDPGSGERLDEVVALWMPGPASYTRQDVLEIQCHGGHAAARAILEAAQTLGARLAGPGEFTLRAFLAGRIDLVQAEAVLDVIRARTEESLRIHHSLLSGHLSTHLESWQERLGRVLVAVEAHLDFPEEEVGEPDGAWVAQELQALGEAMVEKLESYRWGRTARDGFTAALVGSPNTGKSSLLNRLAQEDRAIVSPIPGTTRDLVEAWIDAEGVPVRLVDTAGLRAPGDEVEEEGVRRARRAAGGANLVLFVCDGARPLTEEERREARRLAAAGPALPVVNKRDLGAVPAAEVGELFARLPLEVSARTGAGVPSILSALRKAAWDGASPSAEAPLTRARHRAAVQEALGCVLRARKALEEGVFLELVAAELHGARRHLAELLGWGTPEDVLESIFSEFCIGK
ncbi:MAG: tRNA uridine-5-carboxymethylaminomethyl(34) synthesis GTPase MnmE [Deferrisomatales bacterium]